MPVRLKKMMSGYRKKLHTSKHAILETMKFMNYLEDSDECSNDSNDSEDMWEEDDGPYSSGIKSSSKNKK